jgi:hypothetical protein
VKFERPNSIWVLEVGKMKRGGTNLIEFSGEVKGLDAFHGQGDGGVDVGSME